MTTTEIAWLAGLLEGEGTFLAGPPSAPNMPRIAVEMCDREIVGKVAGMFGVKSHGTRAAKRNVNWSPSYRCMVRGRPAVKIMKAVLPLMGERRSEQIFRAMSCIDDDTE